MIPDPTKGLTEVSPWPKSSARMIRKLGFWSFGIKYRSFRLTIDSLGSLADMSIGPCEEAELLVLLGWRYDGGDDDDDDEEEEEGDASPLLLPLLAKMPLLAIPFLFFVLLILPPILLLPLLLLFAYTR